MPPFPPFTNALSRLHPEGTSFLLYLIYFIYFFPHLTISSICVVVTCPRLDKFYLEHIDRARAHPKRSLHSLVTFCRLAVWGLSLEPTEENLAYEETTSQSKCRRLYFIIYFLYILLTLYLLHHRVSHHEREQREECG